MKSALLEGGIEVLSYSKAQTTSSEYYTVFRDGLTIEVRISDHTANAGADALSKYLHLQEGISESDAVAAILAEFARRAACLQASADRIAALVEQYRSLDKVELSKASRRRNNSWVQIGGKNVRLTNEVRQAINTVLGK